VSDGRRDVATRKITAFHMLAARLVRRGIKPNQVSVISALFGVMGGFAFYFASEREGALRVTLLLAGVVYIQLRLICNLIDGLMAVEGGMKTKSGELFNDVPDRVSDLAFILGAGFFAGSYSPHMLHVAWAAGTAAVLTAYARCLGAAMTGKHDFRGPMAKQHRMFLLTLGSLGGMAEVWFEAPAYSMSVALLLILAGSLWTTWRRLAHVHAALENS
jgi:phosphatidylglycerophosphate synthase